MNKNKIPRSVIGDYIDIATCRAADLLSYSSVRTDLDFNLIFIDQEKFINNLFDILDRYSIVYTKNKDICYRAIIEYKETCTDPELHFDNFESADWVGWCLGIMKLETGKLPYAATIEQAVELLSNDRDYYKNYTVNKMVKING